MTQKLDRSVPPAPGQIRGFSAPVVESFALGNGLTVMVARQGELPLVTAGLVLDAGAQTEADAAEGLARLTAGSLDVGTAKRTAAQIAWDLEHLGVDFDIEPGWDALDLRITAPAGRIASALELLAEIVLEPAFPDGEVARLRGQQIAAIRQRAKEPRGLADDMAARFVYAAEARYARPLAGTEGSVSGLRRDDVLAFHRERFRPDGAALIMTGAIELEAARAAAERLFGSWPAGKAAAVKACAEPRIADTAIHVIDRPGAVQSEIRAGHIGLPRAHPDFFPLLVSNTILGGAFTSRLNLSLRERHGFTYGAGSSFSFRRQPGPFMISLAVGTDVTAPAVRELLNEVDAFSGSGPTEAELDAARDFLAGLLPLRLQTTAQLARVFSDIFLHELSLDYLQTYRQRLAGVGLDDARRAVREHIRPGQLAIVIVGNAEEIVGPLRELAVAPVEVHTEPARAP